MTAAMLPIMMGSVGLSVGSVARGLAANSAWDLLDEAFRVGSPIFGMLAVGLAIAGLRRGGTERRMLALCVALGLGLGETLPLWWVAVEIPFGAIVVIIGLFRGLRL
jgi:hypothetical protein